MGKLLRLCDFKLVYLGIFANKDYAYYSFLYNNPNVLNRNLVKRKNYILMINVRETVLLGRLPSK